MVFNRVNTGRLRPEGQTLAGYPFQAIVFTSDGVAVGVIRMLTT